MKIVFFKEYFFEVTNILKDQNVMHNPLLIFIIEGLKIAFADKSLHVFELKWLMKTADLNGIEREWVMDKVISFIETENAEVEKEEVLVS